jgi:hypothetical protein
LWSSEISYWASKDSSIDGYDEDPRVVGAVVSLDRSVGPIARR